MAIFQHFSFGPPLKISAVYLIGKVEIPIHYIIWAEVELALFSWKTKEIG